jgi:hypothetical protein
MVNGVLSNAPVANAELRVFVSKALCNGVAIGVKPLMLSNVFHNCSMVTHGTHECKAVTDANGLATLIVPPVPAGVKLQYLVLGRSLGYDDIASPASPDMIMTGLAAKKFLLTADGLVAPVLFKKISRADGLKVKGSSLVLLPPRRWCGCLRATSPVSSAGNPSPDTTAPRRT